MFILLGLGAVAAGKALWDNRDKIPDTGYDGDEDDQPKRTQPVIAPRPAPVQREIKLPAARPSSKAWSSPLTGVSDSQWQTFVRLMGDKTNVNTISKSGHIGYFRFSCPRLQELGLCVSARKVQQGDRKVWQGDLLDAGFLTSPRSQLRAFELSVGDLATKIKAENLLDAGTSLDPKPTLSGLLAVAHRAGYKGLISWLKNPSDRTRYPNTTKAFKEANGVF